MSLRAVKTGIRQLTSNDSSVTFTPSDGKGAVVDLSASGGGGGTAYYAWSAVTGSTALVTGHGYVANSTSGAVAFTLPSTAAVGDHFKIAGFGSAGWTLAQNSGQTIHIGATATTTGTGGSVASASQYDGIELICANANTDFVAVSAYDNLTVV